MKVTLKKDEKYTTKVGLDIEAVVAQMERILKHNENLCLTCTKDTCLGIVNIQDKWVTEGYRLKSKEYEENYILECDGYEQAQTDEKKSVNLGKTYRLNHPIAR